LAVELRYGLNHFWSRIALLINPSSTRQLIDQQAYLRKQTGQLNMQFVAQSLTQLHSVDAKEQSSLPEGSVPMLALETESSLGLERA
jgi:hypothetical protein